MTLLSHPAIAGAPAFWDYESEQRRGHDGVLWKTTLPDFSDGAYQAEVDHLLNRFERDTGKQLVPGENGRVALKIYSNSGAGLHTPQALVRAVVAFLLRKGFQPEDICLVDAQTETLRDSGFLPPRSRVGSVGPYFEGIRVKAVDGKSITSPLWYYESPLPKEYTSPLGRDLLRPVVADPQEARKSYLPANLLTEVDFWINLPMASHHPATGMTGALANATLWNISNGTRFFNSPANAPVAVAEIAAIPELKAGWALNLVSLEQYQYIGGPGYNANYTDSLPQLWMSVDPVIMDANLVEIINNSRKEDGFTPLPEVPEFVLYAIQLGMGRGIPSGTKVIYLQEMTP
ncbi:MAG: DUF362 domain-containing protein [Opitutales bacterium]|jgi:hypothetical protein